VVKDKTRLREILQYLVDDKQMERYARRAVEGISTDRALGCWEETISVGYRHESTVD
jgi:hypothetical protein